MSFSINRSKLQNLARAANAKVLSGNSVQDVFTSFKLKMWNLADFISAFDSYTMANWVLFKDRWIHNHTYENTQKYKRGKIVMVDLGASNFRNEPSYEHPCIILANRKNKVLVVPCSGGAYGKGYSDVIDSVANTQGFKKNTGVQVGSIRWIHKNRILYKMSGEASSELLDKIDEFQLALIPMNTKRNSIINMLLSDKTKDEKRIRELTNEISEKDKILEEMMEWFVSHEGIEKQVVEEKLSEILLKKIAN